VSLFICTLVEIVQIFGTGHKYVVDLPDRRVDYPLWKFGVADETYIDILVSEQLDGVDR